MISPKAYSLFVSPWLLRLPPEVAQKITEVLLKQSAVWKTLSYKDNPLDTRLAENVGGLTLQNPIGLAAGFDKNCEMLPALASLGFSYLVAGTVTETPRTGNPRPRIVRLRNKHSVINSLGFPGKGLTHATRKLERAREQIENTRLVVSVSGETVEEITHCHKKLEPLVDAIEINISSPNTAGLRAFHQPKILRNLILTVSKGRTKPLWIKLPHYLNDGVERQRSMELIKVCSSEGIDAVTVANTKPIDDKRLAVGRGGLSGQVLLPDTLRMIKDVASEVGDSMSINACGGVSTSDDVRAALTCKANSVQLYTAMIYKGPGLIRTIRNDLLRLSENSN